jgi:hypothetical protein
MSKYTIDFFNNKFDGIQPGMTYKEHGKFREEASSYSRYFILSYRMGDDEVKSACVYGAKIDTAITHYLYHNDVSEIILSLSLGSVNAPSVFDIMEGYYVESLQKVATKNNNTELIKLMSDIMTNGTKVRGLHLTSVSEQIDSNIIMMLCDAITHSKSLEWIRIDPYISINHVVLITNALSKNSRFNNIHFVLSPKFNDTKFTETYSREYDVSSKLDLARNVQTQLRTQKLNMEKKRIIEEARQSFIAKEREALDSQMQKEKAKADAEIAMYAMQLEKEKQRRTLMLTETIAMCDRQLETRKTRYADTLAKTAEKIDAEKARREKEINALQLESLLANNASDSTVDDLVKYIGAMKEVKTLNHTQQTRICPYYSKDQCRMAQAILGEKCPKHNN